MTSTPTAKPARVADAAEDTISSPEIPPPSVPAPLPESTPETPEPAPDIGTLAAKFRSEQNAEIRSEIATDLWELDTREAVETLRVLFLGERNPDVKADILAGIAASEEQATHESCYGLLLSAFAPGQPPEVRLLAAHLFTDFKDARIPNLLQQFSQDPDPEVREAVKAAIDTLRENQSR